MEGPLSDSEQRALEAETPDLPASYRKFVLRHGSAKLYREDLGYQLGVRGKPVRALSKAGEALLCVGHFQGRQAYFQVSQLEGDKEAPIYENGEGGLFRAGESFEAWLRNRATGIRKKLGKRRWAAIVAGPPPFSTEEATLVETRRRFHWTNLGPTPSGDMRIELRNESDGRLPYFSLGVRNRQGTIDGGLFIPTSDLAPSESRIFERDCYKSLIPREDVVLYALPDPDPEDRESYWEFRGLR